MRSIFGWSYPPGCSGPPDYDEIPSRCDACGRRHRRTIPARCLKRLRAIDQAEADMAADLERSAKEWEASNP